MGLELEKEYAGAVLTRNLKKELLEAIERKDRTAVADIVDKLNRRGAYECPEMVEARKFMRNHN